MRISVSVDSGNLKPGMILAEDVKYSGKLMLAKGTAVKPSYINHLLFRGIHNVKVLADKEYYDVIFPNPVQKFYAKTYEAVANIIDNAKRDGQITISHIFPIIESILDMIFSNRDSTLLLTGFHGSGDYLYAHSLDVCIFSLITAKAMNLDYEDVVNLGMGSLLHDIGKTRIAESILQKPGRLDDDEFEEVKKHSMHGYEIVKRISGIRPAAVQAVLQHHERCDGSGYPNRLKGKDIHLLSKIVAVSDIYDALTSDRVYTKKILPHEAAEYLLGISNTLVDSDITNIFIKNIAIYPKGCQVLLNTNEVAIVHDSNREMPLRPVLKIITDCKRNPLNVPFEFELQSHSNVIITQIFS